MDAAVNQFQKRNGPFFRISHELGATVELATTVLQLPIIDGNKEIMLAILFQNCMHPKNHQRRESAANNSYFEIKSQDDAHFYLQKILLSNLKIEISNRESQIMQSVQSTMSTEQVDLFFYAPDIYYAAAVMK